MRVYISCCWPSRKDFYCVRYARSIGTVMNRLWKEKNKKRRKVKNRKYIIRTPIILSVFNHYNIILTFTFIRLKKKNYTFKPKCIHLFVFSIYVVFFSKRLNLIYSRGVSTFFLSDSRPIILVLKYFFFFFY